MLSYDKSPTSHYGPVSSSHLSSPSIPAQMPFALDAMPHPRHLFIVTGPAGCGKSTIAKCLADQFEFPYIEGDDHHSKSNKAKMSAGIPLNDGDRWDWLTNLREEAVKELENGAQGAILTCSALKLKYRDVIRIASYNNHNVHVHFIYLRATEEILIQRVMQREGHYMKANLVKSQICDLEEPRAIEHDVLSIDVSGPQEEVAELAMEAVASVIAQDSVETR
jgi:gluconokinase